MKFGHIALAALTLAALSPAVSIASPEKGPVKACARAFASSIAGPGAETPAYKLSFRGSAGSAIADFYPTEYTFTLEARSGRSGAAIARATCSVDSRGIVTSIAALPLTANPASLASGL